MSASRPRLAASPVISGCAKALCSFHPEKDSGTDHSPAWPSAVDDRPAGACVRARRIAQNISATVFCVLRLAGQAKATGDALILSCAIQNEMEMDDVNPTVEIAVSVSSSGWSVVHTARDGSRYSRMSRQNT